MSHLRRRRMAGRLRDVYFLPGITGSSSVYALTNSGSHSVDADADALTLERRYDRGSTPPWSKRYR